MHGRYAHLRALAGCSPINCNMCACMMRAADLQVGEGQEHGPVSVGDPASHGGGGVRNAQQQLRQRLLGRQLRRAAQLLQSCRVLALRIGSDMLCMTHGALSGGCLHAPAEAPQGWTLALRAA